MKLNLNNELYVEHLREMCKFPTVSSADPEKTRVKDFMDLQAYLEKAYPNVHKTMTKEIIGKAGLLFHWKGTGKSDKLPVLVMAHQDVVPEGDLSAWKYPPYESHLDEEGILWARGCTDCKNVMQAELDALELLISEGFVPDFDIYAAFGYNEEIMGGPGAACRIIVDELKARNVQVGLVIDEGAGVKEINGSLVASVCTCEKGYADHEFYVEDAGGHAAMPPKHNSLGKLGYYMWQLEEHPMEPVLCQPVIDMMKAQAEFTPGHLGELFKDPEANWEELKKICSEQKNLNTLIRTTTTPTMAKGSDQANILPERASIITNSRLLPGQTLDDLMAHFRSVLPGEVNIRLVKGHNPPMVSTTDSYAYRLITGVTAEMHPGVKFVPTMVYGGTDSRYYTEICPTESVYRYSGGLASEKSGGAHQVNEHVDTSTLASHVEFFARVFLGYADAK